MKALRLFAIASVLSAQTAAIEHPEAAEQFLTERLSVWRQRLNLEDWQISVVMAHRYEMKPGTLGSIRWDKPKKKALLSVLHVSDYHMPGCEMLDDLEFTIVHELLHLGLASRSRGDASRETEERAVNQIAKALIALDKAASGGVRCP